MRAHVTTVMLLFAAGLGAVASSDSGDWKVRSYLDGPNQACHASGVELVLRSESGNVLSAHPVIFEEGVHDDLWPVPSFTGDLSLAIYRIDCAGVRGRVAELTTTVHATTQAKQVYVAATVHEDAVDPRFIEVDTYRYVEGDLSAQRIGSRLLLTNQGDGALQLCGQSGVQSIRDEYLIDGKWRTSSANNWAVPRDVSSIAPGAELTLRPTILKYLPPSADQPRQPDAARVMIAIKPARPTHVALGQIPTGFLGFPGCDFIFVSRAVTEHDQIWLRDSAEP